MNSTTLWHTDSPTEPTPICPHTLLTQRDEGCTKPNDKPSQSYAEQMAQFHYGTERWTRISQLKDIFWTEWQNYNFDVAQKREKWMKPCKNAQVGDMVLLCDKNLPRLQWAEGTIIAVKIDEDGLVRKVTVKPFLRPDRPITEAPRKRSIHDLVLIKEIIPQPDSPESTTQENS